MRGLCRSVLVLCVVLVVPSPAAQDAAPWIALEGIDPVLLLGGEERQGKLEFSADFDGIRYLFTTGENRDRFINDPARYAARYGVCARMGPSNPFCHHALASGGPPGLVHPDIWAVVGKRIYLFWTMECRAAFMGGPDKYLEPEPAMDAVRGQDSSRARALLAKAVAAAGGADRLNALRTYVATSSRTMRSPVGDVPATATVHWALPDRVRIAIEGGPMTFVAASTSQRGFVLSAMKGRGRFETTMSAAQREWYIRRIRYHTDPIGILSASPLHGVEATTVEETGGAEAPIAIVDLRVGGAALRLGINSMTGRIATMSFVDRNAEGIVGNRVLTFDDHREIGGLAIPHTVIGRFNGEPDPEWTWKVTVVRLNEPIEPALFEQRK